MCNKSKNWKKPKFKENIFMLCAVEVYAVISLPIVRFYINIYSEMIKKTVDSIAPKYKEIDMD